MFWGIAGFIALGLLTGPVWRFARALRDARVDDGLMLMIGEYFNQPEGKGIEWLGQAIAAERQGKARPGHIATLELALALELMRSDRKHDALALFERHLPQPGIWEKYLGRADTLVCWGVVAWQRGQLKPARIAIDAALETTPSDATVLRVRGLIERRATADLAATKVWFDKALAMSEPEDRTYDQCKISCYTADLRAELGDLESAVVEMSEAIKAVRAIGTDLSTGRRVEIAGFALHLVRMLCRLNRPAEARKAFDAADMPQVERGIMMLVEVAQCELEAAEGQAAPNVPKLQALLEEARRRKDDDDIGTFTVALAHVQARAGDLIACRESLSAAHAHYVRLGSKSDQLNVENLAKRLGLTLD